MGQSEPIARTASEVCSGGGAEQAPRPGCRAGQPPRRIAVEGKRDSSMPDYPTLILPR
ncbi:hypothetical protein B0I35DRAFT_446517 [Stachybotrys elegans]|uniref:Uncharacterized protein n=1 Tax=Stachybotrys elegans TaxID=80388 RepID=A0A8K0WKP7_9HYPO|nr:hypothetical protein B0I35DRAFT_446517 [Stachybotrys elegans]